MSGDCLRARSESGWCREKRPSMRAKPGGSPGVISVGTQRVPSFQEPPRNVCVQSCLLAQGQGADSCRRLAELGEPTTESETPSAVARPSRVTSAHTQPPSRGLSQCPAWNPGSSRPWRPPQPPHSSLFMEAQGRGLALPAWHPARKPHLQSGCNLPSQADGATVKVEAKKHFTSLDGKGSSRE